MDWLEERSQSMTTTLRRTACFARFAKQIEVSNPRIYEEIATSVASLFETGNPPRNDIVFPLQSQTLKFIIALQNSVTFRHVVVLIIAKNAMNIDNVKNLNEMSINTPITT